MDGAQSPGPSSHYFLFFFKCLLSPLSPHCQVTFSMATAGDALVAGPPGGRNSSLFVLVCIVFCLNRCLPSSLSHGVSLRRIGLSQLSCGGGRAEILGHGLWSPISLLLKVSPPCGPPGQEAAASPRLTASGPTTGRDSNSFCLEDLGTHSKVLLPCCTHTEVLGSKVLRSCI